MGCGGSTGSIGLAAEEEVPVLEVPGGGTVSPMYPHKAVRSCVPLKYSLRKATANMSDVNAQIASPLCELWRETLLPITVTVLPW